MRFCIFRSEVMRSTSETIDQWVCRLSVSGNAYGKTDKKNEAHMAQVYKPGEVCQVSGQYAMVWIATGTPVGHERTVVRGEVFPPTLNAGQGYILVDPTRV